MSDMYSCTPHDLMIRRWHPSGVVEGLSDIEEEVPGGQQRSFNVL
jgi:hypothetical protein